MAAADCWRLIWECAGITGLDPKPLTLRELAWAVFGRQESEWMQTATIVAAIINAAPFRRGRAIHPAQIMPRNLRRPRRRREPGALYLTPAEFKAAFLGK